MIDVEPLIGASFDRMLPERAVAADWQDVLERAGIRRRPRASTGRYRYVVAALALVAFIGAVGAAYALGYPIVGFSSAPHASRTIVDDFGQLTVIAVPTPVLPHEARLITTVRIDGRKHPLFVAPVRGGGFCYLWGNSFGGSCLPGRHGLGFGGVQGIGATRYQGREYMKVITGLVPTPRATHVVLHYADGQTADIPFVWVTRPIRNGFFLYGVPTAHQRPGHQPIRISLTDSAGAVIASQRVFGSFPVFKPKPPPYRLVRHRLAGYPRLNVPAPAIWAKRQQLFSSRAFNGTRVGLWIAPSHGSGTCYWSNVHAGCGNVLPATSGIPRLQPSGTVGGADGVTGGASPSYWLKVTRGRGSGDPVGRGYVVLCCTLDPRSRSVKLRFQGGEQVTLTPKRGYLIWPIPRRHYRPGHRLEEVDLYDRRGNQIGSVSFLASVRELYPCTKPKNYGYGVKMCP